MDKQFTAPQRKELENYLIKNTMWCADGKCRVLNDPINIGNIIQQSKNYDSDKLLFNNRLNKSEGRILTLEGQDLNNRLTNLENLNLNNRLSVLEDLKINENLAKLQNNIVSLQEQLSLIGQGGPAYMPVTTPVPTPAAIYTTPVTTSITGNAVSTYIKALAGLEGKIAICKEDGQFYAINSNQLNKFDNPMTAVQLAGANTNPIQMSCAGIPVGDTIYMPKLPVSPISNSCGLINNNILLPGQGLYQCQALMSSNGKYGIGVDEYGSIILTKSTIPKSGTPSDNTSGDNTAESIRITPRLGKRTVLGMTKDKRLVLYDMQGKEVWEAGVTCDKLHITDTGYFALLNGDNIVWIIKI